MKLLSIFLDWARAIIRSYMTVLARGLNRSSGGRISPTAITVTALLAHIPIAWLTAMQQYTVAALLLIIFGLFDALDGALARVQHTASHLGMFVDSATDRIKEVMLYCGIIAALTPGASVAVVVMAAGALGISLCISYLNAWGEAVLAGAHSSGNHTMNQSFRGGLLGFDLRMTLIISGLLSGRLDLAIYAILVLGTLTVVQRFMHIVRRLQGV